MKVIRIIKIGPRNTLQSGELNMFGFIKNVANTAIDKALDAAIYVEKNPKKCVAVVVGTVATGGVAFVAAPAIAAGIGAVGMLGATASGTAISSLSGVALTNASLAALGGGTIAAGGAGMAGGVTVITGTGVATGAVISSSVASKVK